MKHNFTFSHIENGRVRTLKVEANTMGEARAKFKRLLGLKSRGRLPVGARQLMKRKPA